MVEDLLAHPLIWRGQSGGFTDVTAALATGFPVLDGYLPGGGWPLTGISEVFVERYGLGELRVLMPALAALSRRAVASRQWIVWVAPPFIPYAPALAQHGIDLRRILLVHPTAPGARHKGAKAASAEALWAVEQAIRSQSSVAVLAWVRSADMPALRRLQLAAEACRCWTVLFRPLAAIAQTSPAVLQFTVSAAEENAEQQIHIGVRKCRGRKPQNFRL